MIMVDKCVQNHMIDLKLIIKKLVIELIDSEIRNYNFFEINFKF